ncbi:phage major capsid protein [Sphingobacterium mizutaii]|uniref:phage major capsid protein n=1 Tax=Sphingobacterium mizutaii TaxID=1010 RepID=UPI00289E6414|nr:phage major capsid protein [Sphingobacterium mizutaii]
MSELTEKEKQDQAAALEVVNKAAEAKAQEVVNKAFEGKEYISKEDAQKEASEIVAKFLAEQKEEFNKEMAKISAQIKKASQTSLAGDERVVKTFNEYIADAITEQAEKLKSYDGGEMTIALKAVGDMSIANNFPGATPWIQDVRSPIIPSVYDRVWLADQLPQGTSDGNSVIYPKENGGEGEIGVWVSGSGPKPKVDFDLTSQSAFFKWLAGYVIIDREMLDDIPWLISYLQNKLLISLKLAENKFVLNGAVGGTNPVDGLLTVATPYSGTFTNPVDRLISAAYGQIVQDTKQFYRGTNSILTPLDSVNIGLNKAEGSGEYDLPAGSVSFANGRLSVGGLVNVESTEMALNNFLTFDRNAILFLRRLQPELKVIDTGFTLASENKVMIRIEERVTMAIFNDDAIVKGLLTPVTP